MRNKITLIAFLTLTSFGLTSVLLASTKDGESSKCGLPLLESSKVIRMAISHGHCNLPLEGRVENIGMSYDPADLTTFRLNFEMNTETIVAVFEETPGKMTEGARSEDMFMGDGKHPMNFETEDVFSLGNNWYQLRGKLTLRGITKICRLRMSPMLNGEGANRFVIDGVVDLLPFGFDVDTSDEESTDIEHAHGRFMFMNMVISETDA